MGASLSLMVGEYRSPKSKSARNKNCTRNKWAVVYPDPILCNESAQQGTRQEKDGISFPSSVRILAKGLA